MIVKRQPKELEGKPLISEKDPQRGDSDVYIGRVIIEVWGEENKPEESAFAWSVDGPDQANEEWHKLFFNELKEAVMCIEATHYHQQKD